MLWLSKILLTAGLDDCTSSKLIGLGKSVGIAMDVKIEVPGTGVSEAMTFWEGTGGMIELVAGMVTLELVAGVGRHWHPKHLSPQLIKLYQILTNHYLQIDEF